MELHNLKRFHDDFIASTGKTSRNVKYNIQFDVTTSLDSKKHIRECEIFKNLVSSIVYRSVRQCEK